MATPPQDWNKVKVLFIDALELPSGARAAFLRDNCQDAAVRTEVERLLAEHMEAGEFLSSPALLKSGDFVNSIPPIPKLPEGELVANRFRIVSFIAKGGMGEVYKAADTRLHRFVVLKFLPAELAHDRQALARFQREARVASALNHPSVCTIYDIVEQEGHPFIAMEFLEGTTLTYQIEKRLLNWETLLDLAINVTSGLEAAHASGIIHRDIKPSNIFVTKQGSAKILDFGVAKFTAARNAIEFANTTTQVALLRGQPLTESGMAIGTIAYMSPEQVQAKDLDIRTDLFSFGAVLYEMATGAIAFGGQNPGLIVEAILDWKPIPPQRLNPDLPDGLDLIINKCLEKDRSLRYQHASEIRTDLIRLRMAKLTNLSSFSSERNSVERNSVFVSLLAQASQSIRNLAKYGVTILEKKERQGSD